MQASYSACIVCHRIKAVFSPICSSLNAAHMVWMGVNGRETHLFFCADRWHNVKMSSVEIYIRWHETVVFTFWASVCRVCTSMLPKRLAWPTNRPTNWVRECSADSVYIIVFHARCSTTTIYSWCSSMGWWALCGLRARLMLWICEWDLVWISDAALHVALGIARFLLLLDWFAIVMLLLEWLVVYSHRPIHTIVTLCVIWRSINFPD